VRAHTDTLCGCLSNVFIHTTFPRCVPVKCVCVCECVCVCVCIVGLKGNLWEHPACDIIVWEWVGDNWVVVRCVCVCLCMWLWMTARARVGTGAPKNCGKKKGIEDVTDFRIFFHNKNTWVTTWSHAWAQSECIRVHLWVFVCIGAACLRVQTMAGWGRR